MYKWTKAMNEWIYKRLNNDWNYDELNYESKMSMKIEYPKQEWNDQSQDSEHR